MAGIGMEQINFMLKSFIVPSLFGRDHSLKFLRIPYLRNVIHWGSSVLTFISLSLCISNLSLRLGSNFLFLGRPSFNLEYTREGLFSIIESH